MSEHRFIFLFGVFNWLRLDSAISTCKPVTYSNGHKKTPALYRGLKSMFRFFNQKVILNTPSGSKVLSVAKKIIDLFSVQPILFRSLAF